MTNWRRSVASLCAVALVLPGAQMLFATGAEAAPYTIGDLLVSQYSANSVSEYKPDGTLVQTLSSSGGPAGSRFDAAGNFFVTAFGASKVDKFDANGNSVGVFGSGYNTDPESILFDNSGNAYVGQADGSHQVLKFDSAGNLLATYSPAVTSRGTDWIELAADQCTLYYTSEGTSIKRFNVCTNTQLVDFATGFSGSAAYEVRLRPNGDVLVADSDRVLRLNSSGALIQTYTRSGDSQLFALTLDPDGTSFWTGDLSNGDVARFDIATGNVISFFNAPGVSGLTVRGEIPASIAGPTQIGELLGGSNPSEKNQCTCTSTRNPVNDATGNFFHTFTDISIPGRGLPLNLQRTYNSLAAAQNGPFGYGWSFSYGASLSVDGNGNVTIAQENGSTVNFTKAGSVYTPPSRVLATLIKNGDGTYTFRRADQTQYQFSASGQLTQASDHNNYHTTFTYPAGQEVITDPAGRTLTLTLTAGQVTSAADSTGRSVAYQYDGSGNLQQVTDVNGGLTKFSYYADHTMHTMTDPNQGVVTNVFDATGRTLSQTDPMQRLTTFDYSTPGQTKITDPMSNATIEVYANNILQSRTLGYGTPQAATWQYTYDPATLGITSISDPNQHVVHNTWDGRGNLLTHVDGLNRPPTINTYDSLNDLLTQKDPLGVTTTNAYDPVGNLLSTSRPLVGTTQTATVTYRRTDLAHLGDVTGMTDPDQNLKPPAQQKSWQYGYDQYGNRNLVIDPLGNKTTSTFNADGWVQTMVSPNGYAIGPTSSYTTTYDYTDQRIGGGHVNGFGDIGVTTDPLGRKTTVTYDANRNIAYTKDASLHTTQNIYDLDNELTEVDRADGSKVKTVYDNDGNVQQQIDGLSNTTTYAYDPLNHKRSAQDPLTRTTNFVFDAVGNLKTVTDPQSQTTTYGYDAADELTSITYSDGRTPNVGPIHYDADGQRLDITDGTGTTTYVVDSLHRLTQQTNGFHSTVNYGYDLRGLVTSITYPGQTKPLLRTYDDANRMKSVTDWLGTNGNTTTYNYDANSNLTGQVYPNGTTATFTPDAANQINSIVDKLGTNSFLNFNYTWDSSGQLKTENSTVYGYNTINQLTTTGPATYGYDAGDNLTQQTNGTIQSYDAAHQLQNSQSAIGLIGTASGGDSGTSGSVTLTMPTGVIAGDQILIATTGGPSTSVTPTGYTVVGTATSGGTTPDQTVIYRKAAIGGETTVTLSYVGTPAKSVVAAVYRGADPVTPIDVQSSSSTIAGRSVTAPSVTSAVAGEKLVMLAGAAGNPTPSSWTAPAGMQPQVQKSGNANSALALSDQTLAAAGATGSRTATFGLSANLTGFLVTIKPAVTGYSYDARGNRSGTTPPGGSTTTLGYDQANRMVSYGTLATYSYNADGLRMTSTESGVSENFVYDVAEGLPQFLSDASASYVNGPLGSPLEQISGGTVTYFHQDQLGSTRALTNAAGAVVATYDFNAYGKVSRQTGPATTHLQFAGQYKDSESGLYYLRARYYDPSTGQFISRDPAVATTRQPYAYVGDNPVNAIDPSGLWGYQRDWNIGAEKEGGLDPAIVGSPAHVMAYFRAHASEIFPFSTGGCSQIYLNENCALDFGPFPGPVKVTACDATSFTFTTQQGHYDLPGSTIKFSTYEQDGNVYLRQQGTWVINNPLDLAKALPSVPAAWVLWKLMADNLRAAVAKRYQ